jgi:hypothetical protein
LGSWPSNRSPHGHVINDDGVCDGSFSPRAHVAYFRAVQSRCTPFLEGAFRDFRQQGLPIRLEASAGDVEED